MSDEILKKFKADFERSFGLTNHDLSDDQADAIQQATDQSNSQHWADKRAISDDDVAEHQHAISTSWDQETKRVPREPATSETMAKLQALLDAEPVALDNGQAEVTALIGSNLEVQIWDDDDLLWYSDHFGVDLHVVKCVAAMITEIENQRLRDND